MGELADRTAARLAALGVGRGSIVGVCGERSPELLGLMAGLLGVLERPARGVRPARPRVSLRAARRPDAVPTPASRSSSSRRTRPREARDRDRDRWWRPSSRPTRTRPRRGDRSHPAGQPRPTVGDDSPGDLAYVSSTRTSGSTDGQAQGGRGEPRIGIWSRAYLASREKAYDLAAMPGVDPSASQAGGPAFGRRSLGDSDPRAPLCSGGTLRPLSPRDAARAAFRRLSRILDGAAERKSRSGRVLAVLGRAVENPDPLILEESARPRPARLHRA